MSSTSLQTSICAGWAQAEPTTTPAEINNSPAAAERQRETKQEAGQKRDFCCWGMGQAPGAFDERMLAYQLIFAWPSGDGVICVINRAQRARDRHSCATIPFSTPQRFFVQQPPPPVIELGDVAPRRFWTGACVGTPCHVRAVGVAAAIRSQRSGLGQRDPDLALVLAAPVFVAGLADLKRCRCGSPHGRRPAHDQGEQQLVQAVGPHCLARQQRGGLRVQHHEVGLTPWHRVVLGLIVVWFL